MINRLTQNIEFQAQALLLRSERQRLIASNIANADTPGYVARDFDFSRALRDATSTTSGPGRPMRPLTGSDLLLRYATPAQDSMDRNTVDMDRERASFADNTVKYEATVRFITRSMRTMTDAMKSHTAG